MASFYTEHRERLLARFAQEADDWRQAMASAYDADVTTDVLERASTEFEALIPQLPDLGGEDNPFLGSFMHAVRCLALYRALRAQGATDFEVGRVLYDSAALQAARPAPPRPAWLTDDVLMQRRRAGAERSQQRAYPADFVFEFVDGDGVTFDYGYDFTECACLKLYQAQGTADFLPYVCFLDFPLGLIGGFGLSRTMTLAGGDPLCNHRFRRGAAPAQAWPPPFGGGSP